MTDEIINYDGFEMEFFNIHNLINNPSILIFNSENKKEFCNELFHKITEEYILEFEDLSLLDYIDNKLQFNQNKSNFLINCSEITEKLINQPPISSLLYSNKLYNSTLMLSLDKYLRFNPYIITKFDYVFLSKINFYGDLREIHKQFFYIIHDFEDFLKLHNYMNKNNLIMVFHNEKIYWYK